MSGCSWDAEPPTARVSALGPAARRVTPAAITLGPGAHPLSLRRAPPARPQRHMAADPQEPRATPLNSTHGAGAGPVAPSHWPVHRITGSTIGWSRRGRGYHRGRRGSKTGGGEVGGAYVARTEGRGLRGSGRGLHPERAG